MGNQTSKVDSLDEFVKYFSSNEIYGLYSYHEAKPYMDKAQKIMHKMPIVYRYDWCVRNFSILNRISQQLFLRYHSFWKEIEWDKKSQIYQDVSRKLKK
jgi:hypothetical protein